MDPSLRLISPGSLPRTEVGMWGAPQQMGGETASALALSSSRRGPGGASAGWGHIEVVHGGSLSQEWWRRVTHPTGIDGPKPNRPRGLLWAGTHPRRVSLSFVGHIHVPGWHCYQLQNFWLEGHFPVV